jgi:hypothetical protein
VGHVKFFLSAEVFECNIHNLSELPYQVWPGPDWRKNSNLPTDLAWVLMWCSYIQK